MFTVNELVRIGQWIEENYAGEYWFSFVQGFEGRYIIVEPCKGQRGGREVYKIEEILGD